MILAIIKRQDNEKEVKLYWDTEEFWREHFAGNVIEYIDMTIRGRRFRDKQNCLREIAEAVLNIEIDDCFCDSVWWLADHMADYFYKNGKRYGLLRELRYMGLLD